MRFIAYILLTITSTLTIASPVQELYCQLFATQAHDIQLKRQHREYNFEDFQSFVSYRHAEIVRSDTDDIPAAREQYLYLAAQVYSRPLYLNPTSLQKQVYDNCMLKHDWEHTPWIDE